MSEEFQGAGGSQSLGFHLRVSVRSPAGEPVAALEVPESLSAGDLKSRIRQLGGPPVERQRLVHELSVLDDAETLGGQGVVGGLGREVELQLVLVKPARPDFRVVARCRPLSVEEATGGKGLALEVRAESHTAMLTSPDRAPKMFELDAVHDGTCPQSRFFDEVGLDIVESVLEGYNGTIITYGQTGAGKSHTMLGPEGCCAQLEGLIPRAIDFVFASLASGLATAEWRVGVSYLEIYGERLRDLLETGSDLQAQPSQRGSLVPEIVHNIASADESPSLHSFLGVRREQVAASPLRTRTVARRPFLRIRDFQAGSHVEGLSVLPAHSAPEARTLLAQGLRHHRACPEPHRATTVWTLTVETRCREGIRKQSKLQMVDCGGSERGLQIAEGQTRMRDGNVRLSLSALGNVISALAERRPTIVPYRDSKLTHLLKDSLGGSARTVWVACCGPALQNSEESLSTLRYAFRAKRVNNQPVMNLVSDSTSVSD